MQNAQTNTLTPHIHTRSQTGRRRATRTHQSKQRRHAPGRSLPSVGPQSVKQINRRLAADGRPATDRWVAASPQGRPGAALTARRRWDGRSAAIAVTNDPSSLPPSLPQCHEQGASIPLCPAAAAGGSSGSEAMPRAAELSGLVSAQRRPTRLPHAEADPQRSVTRH